VVLINGEEYHEGVEPYTRIDNREPGFLQWFLDSKEAIENLKFMWRGYEENYKGQWQKTPDSDNNRIMNERGIHWATSLLRSYLNKNFQSTSWNEEHMNYEMRQAVRTVWHTLMTDFRAFGLSKINAAAVGRTMVANIHSMMLAARGNGVRDFLTKSQTVSEQRVISGDQSSGPGVFSGLTNIFRKSNRGMY
jgi:hypothetical protein